MHAILCVPRYYSQIDNSDTPSMKAIDKVQICIKAISWTLATASHNHTMLIKALEPISRLDVAAVKSKLGSRVERHSRSNCLAVDMAHRH